MCRESEKRSYSRKWENVAFASSISVDYHTGQQGPPNEMPGVTVLSQQPEVQWGKFLTTKTMRKVLLDI